MGVCNSEKPLLVAPTLKRDSIGICVWPSKFKTEETVLSERDRRRIVSIIYFLKNSNEWNRIECSQPCSSSLTNVSTEEADEYMQTDTVTFPDETDNSFHELLKDP